MKNVYEVLRQKELEVSRLKQKVAALRVAAPLLSEDGEGGNDKKPRLASPTEITPLRNPITVDGTTSQALAVAVGSDFRREFNLLAVT